MSLNSTYLELVNSTLIRINQPKVVTLVGITGRGESIAAKYNDIVNNLLLEADWWNLFASRTFSSVASVQNYNVAADFTKAIMLFDTSTKLEYHLMYPRAFEINDLNQVSTFNNFYTLENNQYRLLPIPSTVLNFRDVYWRAPTELLVDSDKPDLPPGLELMIKEFVYGSISGDMGNFEAKDRANIDYLRALTKAKNENNRIIDSMLSSEHTFLANATPQLRIEGQTFPLNGAGF